MSKRRNALGEEAQNENDWEDAVHKARFLLDIVENSGMLPPEIRFFDFDENDRLKINDFNGDYVNWWENK